MCVCVCVTRDEEATVTPERLIPTTSKRNLTMGPAAGNGAVGCSATTPVNVADFSRRAHCQRTNFVVLPKTAVLMSPERVHTYQYADTYTAV